ncbi:MAG: DUF3574 domain-containing protein [Nitrospira sp.]|nr:DUF3574 domain-containing protein [Nitrospira sp.]
MDLFTQLFVERASRNNGIPLFRYGKARRSGDSRRWNTFVKETVTPAFPEGLTSWAVSGR